MFIIFLMIKKNLLIFFISIPLTQKRMEKNNDKTFKKCRLVIYDDIHLLLCICFTNCFNYRASRGIGFTTAELLASEGYIVYAGMRSNSSLTQMFDAQHKYPSHFYPISLDVTDQSGIDKAIQMIQEREGHLDVLINNAGIMTYGSIENLTIDEAQQLFDVNFFGVMRVTQAVLPMMRVQKKGKIIQISSRSGFRPLPSL
jgi:NADP-dependent 3-hydroxy acid dehydrogenase YdfG